MKKVLAIITFIIVVSSLAAAARADEEIIVSAAASLTTAFSEVGKGFEKANPGIKVVFNFGASGALLQQIASGAPVDVFVSADELTMDQAGRRGLINKGSRMDFAGNELVMIVPAGSRFMVSGIKDLTKSEVKRIGLGNPETVPAGRYAKDALTAGGLWDGLAPKYIYGNTVRQVLDYVERGEVDAGFVFKTDALIAKDKVKQVAVIHGHKLVVYPAAVVAGTKNPGLAGRFMKYLVKGESGKIMEKYGFSTIKGGL